MIINTVIKGSGGKLLSDLISRNITNIEIPSNITKIRSNAFYNCTKLESVIIPNSITTIEGSAFAHCQELKSITIPENVVKIGVAAFYECIELTSVICKSVNPPVIHSTTFGNVPATCIIYVPAESVEVYKVAEFWNERADYIQAILA